jgi:alginate O-acetyltransferase complex protein AlgF
MRMPVHQLLSFLSLFICLSGSAVAEPQLYETGPSEESSYIRFVNATDTNMAIASSGSSAKVELNAQAQRVSRFYPVKSGTKLSANIQGDGRQVSVSVVGKPWEYITIAILPNGATKIKTMLIKETPDDFNAMRSSVALFNLDSTCNAAVMQGGAKNSTILEGVKPFTVQRRLINPVRLSVTAGCGGQGAAVDFAQLQAGERYSVFLLTLKNARQAFFVRDAN